MQALYFNSAGHIKRSTWWIHMVVVWDAGWELQWMWDAFLAAASDGGSHYCEVEGWD